MSLITYECQRADNAHEIKQFSRAAQSLYDYFDGREDLVLFIGNINIGDANLDGLIIKNDAIIIVEFKDYEGSLQASMNGPWICNGVPIKGGASGKTPYEQIKKNQRILRKVIAENSYFTEAQRHDIQGLVVLTKLSDYSDDFDRSNKAWIHVCDLSTIGNIMHEISSRDFSDKGIIKSSRIEDNDILNFIRKVKLSESALVTDFTDTTVLSEDLYNKSHPHNGKYKSTATMLADKEEEVSILQQKLKELQSKLDIQKIEWESTKNEHLSIINQQKADILTAQAEKLEADRKALELSSQLKEVSVISTNLSPKDTADLTSSTNEEEHLLSQVEELINDVQKSVELEEKRQIEKQSDLPQKRKRFGGMKQKVLIDFDVNTESMDDDQLDLIEKNLKKSMIVAGCAGSGKSVIAMHKAQQIIEQGGDVILIAYTKTLNRYMGQGIQNQLGSRFYYHWQWQNANMPSADFIIVDEIQDFDREEILQFTNAARKCFFFFGDTAQSIYNLFGKRTLSIQEISEMTGIGISRLYNNYRLPKPVAKITQAYVGVDVNEFADKIYLSKENELPKFVESPSKQDQITEIIHIINENNYKNVGILVPENEMILEIMQVFNNKSFICEFKYNAGYNDRRNIDTLDFTTIAPKIMTYHSAKGLQFETIILPFLSPAITVEERKALYVAMTRTYRYLYLLYTGVIPEPLNHVPERLYTSY